MEAASYPRHRLNHEVVCPPGSRTSVRSTPVSAYVVGLIILASTREVQLNWWGECSRHQASRFRSTDNDVVFAPLPERPQGLAASEPPTPADDRPGAAGGPDRPEQRDGHVPGPRPFPASTLLITGDTGNDNFVVQENTTTGGVTVSPGNAVTKVETNPPGVIVIPGSTINGNAGQLSINNPVAAIVVQLPGTNNFDFVTLDATSTAASPSTRPRHRHGDRGQPDLRRRHRHQRHRARSWGP